MAPEYLAIARKEFDHMLELGIIRLTSSSPSVVGFHGYPARMYHLTHQPGESLSPDSHGTTKHSPTVITTPIGLVCSNLHACLLG